MKIYFAGIESQAEIVKLCKPANVLFSFATANNFCIEYIQSKDCKSFLLDSGAFTFMNNTKKNVDWKEYIDSYINFINKYDVKQFFELDIDCIVGYENVLKIRRYIEQKTQKRCIPVWHKSRGIDEFIKMCDEYDYVAIGGIVTKEITRQQHKYFKWFIDEAHKRGCKIHGLGYTDMKDVAQYRFDTVDSTTWLIGAKFGNIIEIKNGYPKQRLLRKQGCRIDGRKLTIHNLKTFMSFADYADKYL